MSSIAIIGIEDQLDKAQKGVRRIQYSYDSLRDKGTMYAQQQLRLLLFYRDLIILAERHLSIAKAENEIESRRVRIV